MTQDKHPRNLPYLFMDATPSTAGYLITSGHVYIENTFLPLQKIAAEKTVVGTLEYFLKDEDNIIPPRAFSLAVTSLESIRPISFQTVATMLPQFKFGFNSNIFLARLIEATNGYYLNRLKEHSTTFSFYELGAKRFALFITALYTASVEENNDQLDELIKKIKVTDLYQDGLRYIKPLALPSALVSSFKRSDSVVRFKKNSTVCREGSSGRKMYVLLNGKVNVTLGKRLVSTIGTQGELFCELALFLNGRRTASVVAEQDCDLFVIELSSIRTFHKQHPGFFHACAKTLAQRVVDNLAKIRRLEEIVKGDGTDAAKIAEAQYANLLNEIKKLPGFKANGSVAKLLETYQF